MGMIRGSSYYTTIYGPSWSQAATVSNNLGGYLASVTTDELSIRQLNDGLGIFASGSLEAIVTDSS